MTSTEALPPIIDQDVTLAEHCDRWLKLPFIAIDTEFVRTETFYPIAGLIQVGDGERAFLIDPLKISDWSSFVALLEAPGVIKVLHACGEDLEVFQHLCSAQVTALFDTQLAAAFLGMDFSMGYSRLVSQLLNVELDKNETRSDWLQRPLTPKQLQYAVDDTLHLAEVYKLLAPRIELAGVQDWLFEDTAELVANAALTVEPSSAYRKVKQAWRLKPNELAVLQVLCEWRERTARERDQARNRLLRESTLCAIAQRQPDSLQELAALEDMHPRSVRRDGETILQLVAEAKELDENQWPAAVEQPLPADANRLLKALRKIGQRYAQQLGIASEIMLRKKTLEALVRTGYPNGPYRIPSELHGWRLRLMGDELLTLANQHTSQE